MRNQYILNFVDELLVTGIIDVVYDRDCQLEHTVHYIMITWLSAP